MKNGRRIRFILPAYHIYRLSSLSLAASLVSLLCLITSAFYLHRNRADVGMVVGRRAWLYLCNSFLSRHVPSPFSRPLDLSAGAATLLASHNMRIGSDSTADAPCCALTVRRSRFVCCTADSSSGLCCSAFTCTSAAAILPLLILAQAAVTDIP